MNYVRFGHYFINLKWHIKLVLIKSVGYRLVYPRFTVLLTSAPLSIPNLQQGSSSEFKKAM